jgi:hypothetical protein
VDLGAVANRGLAWWEHYVYVGTPDRRLIAVDRNTGIQAWKTVACESGLTISGAPRVGRGKVFIGNANMDVAPNRGHVDAFDAKTGRHLWRFYTIPGDPAKGFENPAMAMAAKTWGQGLMERNCRWIGAGCHHLRSKAEPLVLSAPTEHNRRTRSSAARVMVMSCSPTASWQ